MLFVLVLSSLASAAAREIVSFDFGWKHRKGLHAWAGPDDRPPWKPDPGDEPAEAQVGYDASDWAAVQLPHDGLIGSAPSKKACPFGCSGRSFIPRNVLWYRKKFSLPKAWHGSVIWLDFEGSFRKTSAWINGDKIASHDCGYTPFRVRLDNVTSIRFDATNEVAVFVDPDNGDEGGMDKGSGWWYEGGGLYRHVHLVSTHAVHVEQDGLFAYSNLTWSSNHVSAMLHTSATITNSWFRTYEACAIFALTSADGTLVASANASVTISPGGSGTASSEMLVVNPSLWTSSQPTLYTVEVALKDASCSGATIDAVSTQHGFRSLHYDPDSGFFLNRQHFKVRGFCDHNTFAVVGMAVPDRINLFRAQALRAVGGNGRRTSHNPPAMEMLSIYDRLGVVVMDENRLFANESRYVNNMGAMVKRDRNHPSVVVWSFCNEAGCEGSHENGGPRFQEISHRYDGTRPTLANMFTCGDLLSNTIDIQGFSHKDRKTLEQCHTKLPHKPIYMSECCSCNTMRDEDDGCETRWDNPHKNCIQMSFNARCAESNFATNASDGVNYAVGTMVWTLFDYYGEPSALTEVSSSYGQYDLCGFPKAAAFWYRMQWLYSVPDGPDKPFATGGMQEVHLVESWEEPGKSMKNARSIHAYTSAPNVELLVNGKSKGMRHVQPMIRGPGSYAEWVNVQWEPGSITAIARDDSGKELVRTERLTNGQASSLSLTIDSPSAATGTGTSLVPDGQDAALLRAAILDTAGHVMHNSSNNISFRVVSGPGSVLGTHNGDTKCQEPNNAAWHSAYHGLVRAVVRVTAIHARSSQERELLAMVDVDGPMAGGAIQRGVEPIVVEATSPGFAAVQVSIPVSTHAEDAVMAVASASAGKAVDFFGKAETKATEIFF